MPLVSRHAPQDLKSKEVAPFLKNLRKMLDHESDDILRWTMNGRAFEIHDMGRMMDYVLPKYFKHRKYTSFQRQLNYFNFKKWTKSKAAVCTFSNDFFLRDKPELAWRITRKKSMSSSAAKNARKKSLCSIESSSPGLQRAQGLFQQAWKTPDMAIVVPRTKGHHYCASFPSPTDMDLMLLEHYEMDVHNFYSQNAMLSQGEDSLDWIDTFLPSLEIHLKVEDNYQMCNSMHTTPSIVRPNWYVSTGFNSLPASNFGTVSTAL